MEILNFLRIGKAKFGNRGWLLLVTILLFPACTSSPQKNETEVETAAPATQPSDQPIYGPEPTKLYPAVVVLGPGMSRAMAAAGVLKALNEAKIPIGAIVATGMGAVIGAMYCTSQTVNEFEWKLTQLNDDDFHENKFNLGQITKLFSPKKTGGSLENKLAAVVGNIDISEARIPLKVGIVRQKSSEPDPKKDEFLLIDRGRLSVLIRVAVTDPETDRLSLWEGWTAYGAAKVNPYPVVEARGLKMGPVIVVNASGEENKKLLSAAEIVIEPKLDGVSNETIQQRSEAMFRGKLATQEQLRQIQVLVGISENG